MAFSTYLVNKLVGVTVGAASYVAPATYIALFTTAPTIAGGGTETTYTNYVRVNATSDWGSIASGSVANSTAISFAACGASGATIVAFGAYDASTAGNLLFFGTCSLVVSSGITPSFAIGAMTVSDN